MTADEALRECERRGIVLQPDGSDLRCRPKSRMTPELREALVKHRPHILARIFGVCPTCGRELLRRETDRYSETWCPATPLDFWLVLNKYPGESMNWNGETADAIAS